MTVAEARKLPHVMPVYLVEISLLNGGPVLYFSDRNITFSGQLYQDYIQNLSAMSAELLRIDSTGLNSDVRLVFKNDRFKTHVYLIEIDDTYPFTGAPVTIKEIYVNGGVATSDYDTVYVGVCEEPREITLVQFELHVSSREFQADIMAGRN